MAFVHDLEEATAAIESVLGDWKLHSKQARACAIEVFDASKNIRKILGLSS